MGHESCNPEPLPCQISLDAAQVSCQEDGILEETPGAQPATFTVHIISAAGDYTLPDAGTAVVSEAGSAASDEPIFDGDGQYAGVLAGGIFKFPKLGHILLPGANGGASANCVDGVIVGGSGWAEMQAAGIWYRVDGKTLIGG